MAGAEVSLAQALWVKLQGAMMRMISIMSIMRTMTGGGEEEGGGGKLESRLVACLLQARKLTVLLVIGQLGNAPPLVAGVALWKPGTNLLEQRMEVLHALGL